MPLVVTRLVMSRNFDTTPSWRTSTVPCFSTTKTRAVSPGGAVTNVGWLNFPIETSWTGPAAA